MQVYGLVGQTSEGIWPLAALRAIYLPQSDQPVRILAYCPQAHVLFVKCSALVDVCAYRLNISDLVFNSVSHSMRIPVNILDVVLKGFSYKIKKIRKLIVMVINLLVATYFSQWDAIQPLLIIYDTYTYLTYLLF